MVERARKPARLQRTPKLHKANWHTERVWRCVRQLAVVYPQDMLLDMACTDGELLQRLALQHPGANLAGICATPQMARTARNRLPDADIMFAELDDLPWLNDSFDVVICAMSVATMKDPATAFSEVRRVLKPGGQFVLAAPHLFEPMRGLVNRFLVDDGPDSAPVYAPKQIKYFLQRAGLEQIHWTRASLLAGITVSWKKKY